MGAGLWLPSFSSPLSGLHTPCLSLLPRAGPTLPSITHLFTQDLCVNVGTALANPRWTSSHTGRVLWFPHQCQEDWVPCPALRIPWFLVGFLLARAGAAQENPALLLSSPCCFHEDAIRPSRHLMSHQIIISLFTV